MSRPKTGLTGPPSRGTVPTPRLISTTKGSSFLKNPRDHSSFTKEEIVGCGHGEMFGPTRPRLPIDNMLMIDRITHISNQGGKYDKGEIRAELDIDPGHWYFACHFMEDPVMPGCLGLDAMWQLVGFYLGWSGYEGKGRALGVGEVKFRGQVLPTAKLVTWQIDLKRVIASELVMAKADAVMHVDGRQIYEAKDLKVGLFKSTENF